MSQETTDNFWKVFTAFEWPETQPVTYRLYHDEQGRPLFYTMEHLPGTYIEVDQDIYVRSPHNVLVQSGKLIVIEPRTTVSKLVPHTGSGTACHPLDICVVTDPAQGHQKWKVKQYDID